MRSRDSQGKQNTPEGASLAREAVKLQTAAGGPSEPTAQPGGTPRGTGLMEKVVARENMLAALERVERNKGAAGIDGIPTKGLRDQIRKEWPRIRWELLEGTYRPSPVRRVEIPKPSGGKRMLGIPTVMDRLIQQGLLQVMTPLIDPSFSKHSYGFRPGRRGHDAVRQARRYIEDGYRWVVDMDLEKFFDKVNHDVLMARVARHIEDKRVLRLIRRYLQAGVMMDGVKVRTEEGTPQGGPLSPLLANILLDDLDKEMEKRGHRFVRYADDCNIYVRTPRAGQRVKESVTTFLEKRLRLKVNEAKTAIARPWRRKFLGFSFTPSRGGKMRIRLAPETVKRVKRRLRELTRRNRSQEMKERLDRINQYLNGWMGYFALSDSPRVFADLDQWLRHRLRACVWKQWKRVRTRRRELLALGLPEWVAHSWANNRKGPWRMSGGPMNRALGIAYWRAQGLKSLEELHHRFRQSWRTAGCRTARPVV